MTPLSPPFPESRLLVRNSVLSPLGGVRLCQFFLRSISVKVPLRVFGKYALVYVTGGEAEYRDAASPARPLRPGDLITVFPDVPHWYGSKPGGRWDQIFIVFEGPVFDAWRAAGLLDPAQPVRHLEPVGYWTNRMIATAGAPNHGDSAKALDGVLRLQAFLAEVAGAGDRKTAADHAWLESAKKAMERFPDDRRAAASLNVSYETFRKRFVHLAGLPPARHRASQVMDEACRLLAEGGHTLREIASRLGFCDEFHFSRRFKKTVGVSPSKFRR